MKYSYPVIGLLVTIGMASAQPASAASTKKEVIELKKEVAELKEGQDGIQKELEEIKELLEEGARAPSAPTAQRFTPTEVSIGDAPFLGDTDAVVTLMEFSDYQCPFCSRHYREVMPTLVKDYVESGQLKYVMRENPIQSLHPRAMAASQAALCARDQGRYWEMHNMIFDNQRQLDDATLKAHAESIGLDTAAFNQCLDSGEYEDRVHDDLAEGRKLGIRGTPGFVLGLTDPDNPDEAVMTEFINGAQSLETFKRTIDDLLADAEEGGDAEDES